MPYKGYQLDTKTNGAIWEEIEHDYIRDNTEAMDIVFKNATYGWVLSQNKTSFGDGIILYTTDSGLSWKLQYHNKTNFLNKMLLFTNNIWVTGRGGLLHSIDDGKSWEYVSIDNEVGYFYGIFFFNETLGWTGSDRGLYKTVDGGMTWNKTESYPYEGRARDIYFTTPMNGWIIHSFGIYHTTDGGDSWKQQHDRGGWSFSFVSDTEAWAKSGLGYVRVNDPPAVDYVKVYVKYKDSSGYWTNYYYKGQINDVHPSYGDYFMYWSLLYGYVQMKVYVKAYDSGSHFIGSDVYYASISGGGVDPPPL